MCLFLFIMFMLQICFYEAESVKVKVEQGWLEGQVLETSTGLTKYNSFKGIPYAAPPIGKLRFKAPQPPLKWAGTRNASNHGSVCVQRDSLGAESRNILGDEDCLFLNVYSPNINPKTPLPVMFFIHGGSWTIGSGNDDQYAPDFLVPYGVVLVTINYRLDVFGYISVDTEEVPGNAGMKDQIAALQWAQRNIRQFGGDPKLVTIFGQSAGGSSVSFHLVSPAAKDLFHGGIAMSGASLNDWSSTLDPRRRAFSLGQKLGIITDDPYILVESLQKISPKNLILELPNILFLDEPSNFVLTTNYYSPIVEKKFKNCSGQYLTECPTLLMCRKQINEVNLMIGHTALEGLRATVLAEDNIFKYFPFYKELLVPLQITYSRSPAKVLELAERVQNFYFGNKTISRENIREFVNFFTYFMYVYDIYAYVEKLPTLPSMAIYFYQFEIYASRNVFSRPGAIRYGIKKATHRDDLPYIFDGSYYNQTVDTESEAFKYIQLMCTLYTNFAKYGTPTPDNSLGLTWPEYKTSRTAVIISERGDLTPVPIDNNDLHFWHQLYLSTCINL